MTIDDGSTTTPTVGTPAPPGSDVTRALIDAAHVAIGFGVIGWNTLQVRRVEIMKRLSSQRQTAETHLDGAKEQFSTLVRNLDDRLVPLRNDLDTRLDKFGERLPSQARDALQTARNLARDTEQQVRQAVGTL